LGAVLHVTVLSRKSNFLGIPQSENRVRKHRFRAGRIAPLTHTSPAALQPNEVSWNLQQSFSSLESRGESKPIASSWSNRISGEETAKIDEVEPVVQVISIHLKMQVAFIALVQVRSERRIQ
jgi:hypothetical protein